MDIEIKGLVKDYGKFRALDGVNLTVGSGMFGLLGPNGAGKTTLMKVITTLLRPTSGTVKVGGVDVQADPGAVRRGLGYLPQEFGFYRGLNAYDLLDYIATMKNVPAADRRRQIDQLLEQVNLTKDAKRRVSGYSGGMKQRLGIAQALLGNPGLLVVDEPTAGLDPEERIRFRNLLARISGQRTIVLSTHIVADIEASCNALAVMNKGRVVFTGTPAELVAQAKGTVWQVEIPAEEYDRFEGRYRIVSSRLLPAGNMLVRVISPSAPEGQHSAAEAGLEDGYVAVMSGVREGQAHV